MLLNLFALVRFFKSLAYVSSNFFSKLEQIPYLLWSKSQDIFSCIFNQFQILFCILRDLFFLFPLYLLCYKSSQTRESFRKQIPSKFQPFIKLFWCSNKYAFFLSIFLLILSILNNNLFLITHLFFWFSGEHLSLLIAVFFFFIFHIAFLLQTWKNRIWILICLNNPCILWIFLQIKD